MPNRSWADQVLGLFRRIGQVLDGFRSLVLKLFELVTLIYLLYKIVQLH